LIGQAGVTHMAGAAPVLLFDDAEGHLLAHPLRQPLTFSTGGAPPSRRATDIVISGGENICSIEVENALMSHPAVADVAVIAVPDDRWGRTSEGVRGAGRGPARRPDPN
jgi:AMP-binding enzyme